MMNLQIVEEMTLSFNSKRIIYSPGLRCAGPPSLPQAEKRVRIIKKNQNTLYFYPLSAAGEERVDERSKSG